MSEAEISEELQAAAAENEEIAKMLEMQAGESENAAEVVEVTQEVRELTDEELAAIEAEAGSEEEKNDNCD